MESTMRWRDRIEKCEQYTPVEFVIEDPLAEGRDTHDLVTGGVNFGGLKFVQFVM